MREETPWEHHHRVDYDSYHLDDLFFDTDYGHGHHGDHLYHGL